MQIDGAGTAALTAIQQNGSLRDPRPVAPAVQGAVTVQTQPLQSTAAQALGFSGSQLSAQAVAALQQTGTASQTQQAVAGAQGTDRTGRPDAGRDDAAESASRQLEQTDEEGSDGLTPEEEATVRALQQRDAEVRRHEQAHAAAGGRYAGPPSYEYERGPDGRLYAVGGEVSIDTSPIPGDPQATIAKAQQVRRAALAPSQPSPQDRRVAAEAQQQIAQARADLRIEQAEARAEEAESRREESNAEEAARGTAADGNVTTPGEAPQRRDAVQQPAAIASDDLASRSLQAGQAFSQSLALNNLPGQRQAGGFF